MRKKNFLLVENELKDVESKLNVVNTRLQKAPDGQLRISYSKGYSQFLFYNSKNKELTYLSNKKTEFIKILFQKKYDGFAKKHLEKKLNKLRNVQKILKELDCEDPSSLIEKIPAVVRKDIIRIEQSDEEYAKQWESVQFKGKEIKEGTKTYKTDKNELVRSKSELNLAKTFYSESIPYRYEFPYTITDDFGRPFQIYPDFTVLNKRTRKEYIVEYFGMMDNPEYVNNMIKKNETYSLFYNQNIKVLYIFESKDCPMNTEFIQKLCRKYFK